jgi:hypothetical protein
MGASDLSNKLWSAVASLNLEDPSFRDLHASQIALALWLRPRNARDHVARHPQWCHINSSSHLQTGLIGAYNALRSNQPSIKYRIEVIRLHRIWRKCVTSHVGLIED